MCAILHSCDFHDLCCLPFLLSLSPSAGRHTSNAQSSDLRLWAVVSFHCLFVSIHQTVTSYSNKCVYVVHVCVNIYSYQRWERECPHSNLENRVPSLLLPQMQRTSGHQIWPNGTGFWAIKRVSWECSEICHSGLCPLLSYSQCLG